MALRRRGAFTLVELLVVITIIGMLMALLLPAVNAAVEAGRNAQCKNNMRNLAMATDTYQTAGGYYPSYVMKVGNTANASWVVALLANLERLDLYQDWTAGTATAPYFDLIVCPSDPPEQMNGPMLSYVANSGCGTGNTAGKEMKNGVFHASGVQTPSDAIVDGKSNTIVFSENIQADKWNVVARESITFVWHSTASPTARQKINGEKTTFSGTMNLDWARPSSFHSGGVNVAFCDTHVTFLKQDVDYGVYAQLMTPNGKESDMQAGWKVPLDDSKYK